MYKPYDTIIKLRPRIREEQIPKFGHMSVGLKLVFYGFWLHGPLIRTILALVNELSGLVVIQWMNLILCVLQRFNLEGFDEHFCLIFFWWKACEGKMLLNALWCETKLFFYRRDGYKIYYCFLQICQYIFLLFCSTWFKDKCQCICFHFMWLWQL